jgi:hypothetical protein
LLLQRAMLLRATATACEALGTIRSPEKSIAEELHILLLCSE